MDLTTLARVKMHIEVGGDKLVDDSVDSLLSALITQYSADAEAILDREVLAAEQTEYFTIAARQRVFALQAWPVSVVTSIYHDTSREWTSGEIDSDNYYLELAEGLLTIDGTLLCPGAGVLRVIYTGGMATDTAALIAAYPDIAGALDAQVTAHYQRRKQLGAVAMSAGQGSVSHDGPLKWLPTVLAALRRHRRITFA